MSTTPTPFGNEADPTKGQPFDPLAIFKQHTGPGYTTSNTPAPVAVAPAFSLPNPFRTDLGPDVNPSYFATQLTASILASILGGTARLEYDEKTQPTGAGPAPWMVDFYSNGHLQMTCNAGWLYLYYQKHGGYTIGL